MAVIEMSGRMVLCSRDPFLLPVTHNQNWNHQEAESEPHQAQRQTQCEQGDLPTSHAES
jgi:hypothetical protein